MKINEFEIEIQTAVSDAVRQVFKSDAPIPDLGIPPENIDAEYTMECFPLARHLRTSPIKIASEIVSAISAPEWMESVSQAGPYLNFKIKRRALFFDCISEVLHSGVQFGWQDQAEPQTILVEYSSPNTNKPLHLGHIRNNVLGTAIIRILRATGHNVIPASIMNDRGVHICQAMLAYQKFSGGQTPRETGIKGDHFVGHQYIRYQQEKNSQPELEIEVREMLRDWERGEPEIRELWETMNAWVYEGFEETYRRLGSEFELVQFESSTYQLGKNIVEQGLGKGVFVRREDGSVWVDLTAAGLDEKAILRDDGTSLYITQDLGVAVERFNSFNLDRVIYIVGSEQNYHFKVLFEILRLLEYPWAADCEHLSYGMVYLPEGKMKSREGKVVDADNLMDRMKQLALDIMESSHVQIEESEMECAAETVGIGAIKYFILKVGPQKDIHFDPEKSMAFEGATGAYLQYTYARINSMLLKSRINDLTHFAKGSLGGAEELAVIRQLIKFPRVVRSASEDLNPSRIAGYLFELAKTYNVFYTKCPVLKAQSQSLKYVRLALSKAVSLCLRSGLEMLGIGLVEKM